MDYVVFGTGYGATLMLLGWALRTFGPGLRYQDGDNHSPDGADMMMSRLSWRRFTSALGAVIATSGIALVLITFITALFNTSNMIGTWITLTCFALILIAVAVWAWFYVSRYGTYGILSEHLDYMSIFRSRSRSPEPAAQSQSTSYAYYAEDAEVDGAMREVVTDDDDDFDEHEARYSKYLVHHPDDADDSVGGFPPADEVEEDVAKSDSGPEPVVEEDEESPTVEPIENEERDVVAEDDSIVSEDVTEDIANDPTGDDEVVDENDDISVEMDDDSEVLDTAGEPEIGDPLLSPDTPESRAEALRRIQEWEPDTYDDGNDGAQ